MMKHTMMLAAAVAALNTFGGIRSVTPALWKTGTNGWQMARHKAKLDFAAKNRDAHVVFIGDSITHFWDTTGKGVWDRYFAQGPRKAINYGMSADETQHVLWRLTEGGELDGLDVRVAVVLIGVNNAWHYPFAQEPPIDTILGIREILRVIREKQPKAHIILQAIFPVGWGPDDERRRRCEVVNREIVKFCDDTHVTWCDFTDKFVNRDGYLSFELFPDAAHPGTLGYAIWAGSVVPLIDKCLAAQPGEAVPGVYASYPSRYGIIKTAQQPGDIPVTRIGQGPWWPDRNLAKRGEIVANEGATYDIVMVGDSITHRWEREGGEGRELFAKIRKDYKILNLGYGGDRTQDVLWRLQNGELEGYKAKLFTLMIGTNNGAWDEKGTVRGVKKILETITARHPESKIILMPIFPCREKPKDRITNDLVNREIVKFADGKRVIWLDFNKDFLTPDGTLTREIMSDLLHPTAKGYEIWWKAMKPVVDRELGR